MQHKTGNFWLKNSEDFDRPTKTRHANYSLLNLMQITWDLTGKSWISQVVVIMWQADRGIANKAIFQCSFFFSGRAPWSSHGMAKQTSRVNTGWFWCWEWWQFNMHAIPQGPFFTHAFLWKSYWIGNLTFDLCSFSSLRLFLAFERYTISIAYLSNHTVID